MEHLNLNEIETGYDQINEKFESLLDISNKLESDGVLSLNTAMEADNLIPDKYVLSTYFGSNDKTQKHQIAVESIKNSIIESIKNAYDYIVSMLKRFIGWLNDIVHRTFTGSKKQTDEIHSVLNDAELSSCMKDVDDLYKTAGNVALEDFYNNDEDRGSGIRVTDVFENFKKSLNEHEIDFLTSGHRYKTIKTVVDDFTHQHYADFINGFSEDIQKWFKEGLDEAPHIGKSDDVVERFNYKRTRQLNTIRQKYNTTIVHIEDLERKCISVPPKGDHTHLNLFQKQPSILFPHIERIWQTIKFEKISEDDRKLIANLEKIRKQFETDGKQFIGKLESKKQFWPAEDVVLRGAQRANREMLKYIASLVKVGGFIKNSANTAYHATVKSFSYISRLLNAIGKLPNVDRDRLLKCIDVINEKRRRIDAITSIT